MKYIKMQGAGNDYVFFDCIENKFDLDPERLSPLVSDRHLGIGADGIILIKNSNNADCFMDIYNADGSRAKMCGNGVRCVAQFYQQTYLPKAKEINVETLSGIKKVKILSNDGTIAVSSVSMGNIKNPQKYDAYFDCLNGRMEYYLVNVGNIHAVCFADKLFQEKFPHIVDELQHKHNNNVNVEFVKKEDKTIKARVFERGSGETLACGTGATAIARVLNYVNNDLTSNYDICFPGGILNVKIDENKNAELTGESELSYIGEINLADLNSFTR